MEVEHRRQKRREQGKMPVLSRRWCFKLSTIFVDLIQFLGRLVVVRGCW